MELPPEQGSKVNKGWLAESQREDAAHIEQSQTGAFISGLSVFCDCWLDLDFRTWIW